MVSSFSNPGFPPVHTHPTRLPAMDARLTAAIDSFEVSMRTAIREAMDSVRDAIHKAMNPVLAEIRREIALIRREIALILCDLALGVDGDFDPASMCSKTTASIMVGHQNPPNGDGNPLRISSTIHNHSILPLLSSSQMLRALANSAVKPHSNNSAAPTVLFPESKTMIFAPPLLYKHSFSNTTETGPEVVLNLSIISATPEAKFFFLMTDNYGAYLKDKFGWVNWYLVGKFVKKDLCASTLFDEMSKRRGDENMGTLFNFIYYLIHHLQRLIPCHITSNLNSACANQLTIYEPSLHVYVASQSFARDVEKPGSQFHMQEICEVFPINATPPMVIVEIVSYMKTSRNFRSLNTLGVQYLKGEVKKRFCKNECKSKKNTEEVHIWDTVLMNFKSGRAVHEELAKYGDLENQVFCKWTYLGHAHMQLNNEKDSREMEACGYDDDLLEDIVLGDLVDGLHDKIGCRVAFPTAAKELGLVVRIPVETSLIDAHVGGVGLLESVPITDSEPKEYYVTKLRSWCCGYYHRQAWNIKYPFWNATLMDKGKKKKSPEEAQKVVGNMNDATTSAIKIKEMEQGLTSLIVLGSGRLSDLIAQLQDILEGVNEADMLPEKFDNAIIRAQIQQLAREFWELTSFGPVTIYNKNSSSSGNYVSDLVPVATLVAMGYCFHDFIFTILVSDEWSHSADCDFQLGYHVPISDTGGTLRGLLTSNVQTKDAHISKFVICTGKFMKNGTIVHLKLGFHEFILDKGGTTIQRLLNSKSTGKVEIILVQEMLLLNYLMHCSL